MKKIFNLLLLSLLLFSGQKAYADNKKTPDYAVIGVVNLLQIQSEAKVYQDIRKKRDVYLEKYKEEIAKKEQEFRKIDQEIAKEDQEITKKDKGSTSEVLEKKKEVFVKQLMDFQSQVQKRRENVGEAFINITTKVQLEALTPIIEEVAKEKGVNVVLNNTQTIFFAPFMDMTDEVLLRLNKKIPSIEFPDPDKM